MSKINANELKRFFGIFLVAIAVSILIKIWPLINQTLIAPVIPASTSGTLLIKEAQAVVVPVSGYQSKILLGTSVLALEQAGVIDRSKVEALYKNRGGLTPDLTTVLYATSTKSIVLTKENANEYLNLLWPLGLANYMKLNEKSKLNGPDVNNFASTGGWTLGRADGGGGYFNKYPIVPLTPAQEQRVLTLAENMYRPCCGNSTFFQDCNHGSALLGLLELGVAQGLTDEELYKEAVAFNSFWFPSSYVETALYFKTVKGLDWKEVDPRIVMSKEYSSIEGWSKNVDAVVRDKHLLPPQAPGGSCSA